WSSVSSGRPTVAAASWRERVGAVVEVMSPGTSHPSDRFPGPTDGVRHHPAGPGAGTGRTRVRPGAGDGAAGRPPVAHGSTPPAPSGDRRRPPTLPRAADGRAGHVDQIVRFMPASGW